MFIQLHEVSVVWEEKEKIVTLVEQIPDDGEDILPLAKYHIKNAFGREIFVKAKCRELAQLAVDEFYGKGFYKVRCDKGDSPKGDVTVRATAYRKGQTVQRNKARILNS